MTTFNTVEHNQSTFIYKPYSLINKKQHQQKYVEKSIIAQLPESLDLGQALKQKDQQIQRLNHALQFYRSNQNNKQSKQLLQSINPFDFYLNTDNLNNDHPNTDKKNLNTNLNHKLEEYLYDTQIKELIQTSAKAYSFQMENQQLKEEIKYLQEEIIDLKQTNSKQITDKQVNKKMKQSLSEVNKLKSQIWSLQTEINRITYQNTQYKKALQSITKIKMGEQSESVLKIIQQSSQFKGQSFSSSLQNKFSQLKQQVQQKNTQCVNLKQKNIQLEAQIFRMNQQKIDFQRQNYQDHSSPSKKQTNRQSLSSQKKINILNSISEFQMIDIDRYQLKITQKNKQYEQLYSKYQRVQSQKNALEDINQELQRQRKFLADRLSQIQILQEGDEVVGEMENKLVLMSTQLMRLGHLNRSKVQQSKQLYIKVKQLIHKLELATKESIEKQKIILNYKEQINLIQQKIQQKNILDQYDQETLQQYKEQLLEKDKEIDRLRYQNKQHHENIKTYQLKIQVFQKKILRIEKQNKDLQKELKQMGKSVMVQSTTKYFNLQLQLQKYKNTASSLEDQLKNYQSKISNLRNQINEGEIERSSFLKEKHTFEQRIHKFESIVKKYEFKIQEKQQQLKNVKHIYEQKMINKNDQIRRIEQKIVIMQKNAESLMKSPKKSVQEQRMLHNFHQLSEQNMLLKIDISKYEQKMVLLTQQIQRLNFTLGKITSQNQNLSSIHSDIREKEKQHRQFKRQIDSWTNKAKRLEQEKNIYQNKTKQLLQEVRRLQTCQRAYRKLTDQYQITVSQLELKEQQYGILAKKLQNHSSLNSPRSYLADESQHKEAYDKKFQQISHQYELKYQNQISSLKRQLQNQQQKINYYEHISNQDNLHDQLSEEIIRLNQILGERIGDIVTLQKQIDLYRHKLQKCQQILSQQRTSKIKQIGSYISSNSFIEVQKNNPVIKNQQKQIILLNERLQSLKQTNRVIQQKFDKIISEKIKLQHKVSQLEYYRGERSMIYHQNQNHLNNLISEIKISNQRLQTSIKQIQNHYVQKIQEKQNQINRLQKNIISQKSYLERKIYQLQSDLRRLNTQNQEKQSLLMQNQQSSLMQQSQHQNIIKIKQEYQMKLALLSQEVERCKLMKDQKTEQLHNIKIKYDKIENQKRNLIIENQSNKNTVQLLSQQIVRLNDALGQNIDELKHKDKQIYKLKQKIEQITTENTYLRQNQEPKSQRPIQVSLTQFQILNSQLTLKNSQLDSEQQQNQYLKNEIRQLQNKLQNQRKQYFEIQEQNNRLIRQKRNISEEKDNFQNKFRQTKRSQEHLKQVLNQELIKRQNLQLQTVSKKNIIEEQIFKKQQHTLNSLIEQIRTLRQSNQMLQNNLELILNENKKLVYQVENFKRSKSNSVASNNNKQDSVEQMNQLRSQNQLLRKEMHQLQQKIIQNNKFRGQVQSYQEQIEELQSRNKKISIQKSHILDELSKIQQQFKQKCQQNRSAVQKLNSSEDQLHSLRAKVERSISEITNLKKEKKQIIQKYEKQLNSSHINTNNSKAQYYTKTIKMTTIDQVDEKQQRSRGPSAHQGISHNQNSTQLFQKYELLQGINQKIKKQNQCYRKKSIQYEFKMNKLKQQFDLLSKLINEYRQENDRLKKGISNQSFKAQFYTVNKNNNIQPNQKDMFVYNQDIHALNQNRTNHIQNERISSQQNQHFYSQTQINNLQSNQSPQRIVMQKPLSTNSTTNLTTTKNGSSVTFKGSTTQMNINDYNSLKQSMHSFQNQISQKNINGHIEQKCMATLSIQQIYMLINEIQRLSGQNSSLLQELNDCKVMLIKYESGRGRHDQNLGTMVLMIVQIQALRHRVAVAEAQRQKLRRQSFSPTKR